MKFVDAPARLSISFSGGRTSGYMTKRLVDIARENGTEFIVTFCNTSQEDERSLKFVDQCDKHWGWNVVWLEAVVNPEHGEGTGFRVVNFDTAARKGEVFENVIKKYGIPNPTFRPCNREMKLAPMEAYRRSLGWKRGTYETAVGIRADEMDRMSASAKENRIIYPLVKWGIRKQDVLSWWAQQPFDLETPEHRGNCITCWKKSDRKLATIAREDPRAFDFFRRMEATYPNAGAGDGNRRFFRHHRTVEDIFDISRRNSFVPWRPDDELQIEMDMLDLTNGCGESCDVFADYDYDEGVA